MKGFVDFIREQGVIGLAVGFILGGSVQKVVTSIVTDIVNPVLGLALGSTKGLEATHIKLLGAKIMYGHFLSTLIDFLVIASVVYFIIKGLRFDVLDKKKK